jgi:hypothetical protein
VVRTRMASCSWSCAATSVATARPASAYPAWFCLGTYALRAAERGNSQSTGEAPGRILLSVPPTSEASHVNSSATVGTELVGTVQYSADENPLTYASFPHT